MDIKQLTVNYLRDFNRYYTAHMELLNSNYLNTNYSLTEIRILFEIWTHKECNQEKITRILNVDKSYLSRILKKLENNDLILRCNDEYDKRKSIVRLSNIGEAEVRKLIDMTNSFIENKIKNLNNTQCRKLCNSIASVTKLLKNAEYAFEIVPYKDKYKKYFIEFNTDWIVSYFGKIEKQDIEEFENIDKDINNGAMIFFAVNKVSVLATCMAKPLDSYTWEICKLGSNKNVPHKGAGSAVFEACMNWAFDNGAKRLFIVSNSSLKPAIHIYKKFGFKEIKLDNYEYERGNIAFEYIK